MGKVPIQVENTSYAPYAFFQFLPALLGKKKTSLEQSDSKKVLPFHFLKTIGQILFLDAAWM